MNNYEDLICFGDIIDSTIHNATAIQGQGYRVYSIYGCAACISSVGGGPSGFGPLIVVPKISEYVIDKISKI